MSGNQKFIYVKKRNKKYQFYRNEIKLFDRTLFSTLLLF